MSLDAPDVARSLAVLVFSAGCGLMLAVNVLAYRVLKPPKHLGFLWWHITAISLSFLCLGAVAIDRMFTRLGEDTSWQLVVTFAGISLFLVAQVLIFNVERSRATSQAALGRAGAKQDDVLYDPASQVGVEIDHPGKQVDDVN